MNEYHLIASNDHLAWQSNDFSQSLFRINRFHKRKYIIPKPTLSCQSISKVCISSFSIHTSKECNKDDIVSVKTRSRQLTNETYQSIVNIDRQNDGKWTINAEVYNSKNDEPTVIHIDNNTECSRILCLQPLRNDIHDQLHYASQSDTLALHSFATTASYTGRVVNCGPIAEYSDTFGVGYSCGLHFADNLRDLSMLIVSDHINGKGGLQIGRALITCLKELKINSDGILNEELFLSKNSYLVTLHKLKLILIQIFGCFLGDMPDINLKIENQLTSAIYQKKFYDVYKDLYKLSDWINKLVFEQETQMDRIKEWAAQFFGFESLIETDIQELKDLIHFLRDNSQINHLVSQENTSFKKTLHKSILLSNKLEFLFWRSSTRMSTAIQNYIDRQASHNKSAVIHPLRESSTFDSSCRSTHVRVGDVELEHAVDGMYVKIGAEPANIFSPNNGRVIYSYMWSSIVLSSGWLLMLESKGQTHMMTLYHTNQLRHSSPRVIVGRDIARCTGFRMRAKALGNKKIVWCLTYEYGGNVNKILFFDFRDEHGLELKKEDNIHSYLMDFRSDK